MPRRIEPVEGDEEAGVEAAGGGSLSCSLSVGVTGYSNTSP